MILDARLGREICKGYAITVIFMTEELLARFKIPKMPLPNLPGLKDKVADMESARVRLNFEFEDSTGTADK